MKEEIKKKIEEVKESASQNQQNEKESDETGKIFEVDFNGHVLAKIKSHNNMIEVLAAINGHGNGLDLNKIEIKQLIH
jgi:hypothetical protein